MNKEIIMVGYAGTKGALHILNKNENDIFQRYHPRYINKIKNIDKDIEVFERIYLEYPDIFSHNVFKISEGGVLSTLYNLAENLGIGLKIEIKTIPIKQETIEICEIYGINPYKLYTEAYLILAEDTKTILELLKKHEIEAKIIGSTTKSLGKLIVDKSEIEHMNKVLEDEIYKIM